MASLIQLDVQARLQSNTRAPSSHNSSIWLTTAYFNSQEINKITRMVSHSLKVCDDNPFKIHLMTTFTLPGALYKHRLSVQP